MLGFRLRRAAAASKYSIAAPKIDDDGWPFALLDMWTPRPPLLGRRRSFASSDVEAEVDDVAFLHHVVPALHAEKAGILYRLHPAEPEQVLVRRDLGAYEAALDVAMDRACGLRRFRPSPDRPSPALFFTGGEERHEVEEPVRGDDEAIEPARLHAELGRESRRLVRRQGRE